MITSKSLLKLLSSKIVSIESEEIALRLIEKKAGINRIDVMMDKDVEIDISIFESLVSRINQNEPIQYVINEEYFFNRPFYVDRSVLIPRPETEELVRHCVRLFSDRYAKIIDIGTGSGCIPISLSLELPRSDVYATDISNEALNVAVLNSRALNAKVQFLYHDILHGQLPFDDFDLIVSNPPYISEREKLTMDANVLDHEPHTALFPESNDVLIFYRAIAKQAEIKLKPSGFVAVEINENFGKETAELFSGKYFSEVTVMKDINGRDRFVIAQHI